jgi:alkylation response protein AidB-like acyl-CoA dehydrogenase
MIPDLTAEDIALRDTVRRFAQSELAPRAAEFDKTEEFVGAHLPKLRALGVMGLNLPQLWGGAGASALGLAAEVEELATACTATASMITAHYLATEAILLAGDDVQRWKYLLRAASGEILGAFALTEPGAGSNPADLKTAATPIAGGFRLKGTKQFISNAAAADFIVVFARAKGTSPTQDRRLPPKQGHARPGFRPARTNDGSARRSCLRDLDRLRDPRGAATRPSRKRPEDGSARARLRSDRGRGDGARN